MRRSIVVLLFVVLALAACSRGGEEGGLGPPADPMNLPDITGSHYVAGVDPLHAEYGGRVLIVRNDDGNYHFSWVVSGSMQEGTGTVDGNSVTVRWRLVQPTNDRTGTGTYVITEDGGLRGTRTVDGYDEVGTEEIFPVRPEDR